MSLGQSTSVLGTYLDGDAVKRSILKLTAPDYTVMSRKHIDRVVSATRDRRYPVEELFRVLKTRVAERNWATSFKTFLLLHILMREGSAERIKSYMGNLGYFGGVSNLVFDGAGTLEDQYLRRYAEYLEARASVVGKMDDFTRDRNARDRIVARVRKLPPTSLIEEIGGFQKLIDVLLKCKDILDQVNNLIVAQCYQLLLGDLMPLFHILNEAMITLLSTFFTLTKSDASKALAAYKAFLVETEETTLFFQAAKRFRDVIAVDVPDDIKVAPQSLVRSLESYLHDPDFEKHRLHYLANKGKADTKRASAAPTKGSSAARSATSSSSPSPASTPMMTPPSRTTQGPPKPKAPAIDFFSSLDEELGSFQASNQSWSPVFANAPQGNLFAGYQPPSQPSFASFPPVSPASQFQQPQHLPYSTSQSSMNPPFQAFASPAFEADFSQVSVPVVADFNRPTNGGTTQGFASATTAPFAVSFPNANTMSPPSHSGYGQMAPAAPTPFDADFGTQPSQPFGAPQPFRQPQQTPFGAFGPSPAVGASTNPFAPQPNGNVPGRPMGTSANPLAEFDPLMWT